MSSMVFWPSAACLLVTLVSPRWWVPALRRWGVVDVPNARSSHRLPTIRGAGLAPAGGVLVATALSSLLLPPAVSGLVVALLCVALAAAVLGLVEDVRGLAVATRAAAQVVIGLVLGGLLVVLLDRPLWWALPVALAGAAYVNAANFMDGVDGMSALHGVVSGAHFLFVGLQLDQPWLVVVGGVVATAFAGFAPWNLLRGRVFLGDVGSYLLGALVVGCGSAALLAGAPPLLAVAPALPYLADTGVTMLQRARRGESVVEAHRSHVYQRLTDGGRSHLASAGGVASASGLCCLAAWWGMREGWWSVGALGAVLVVLVGYLTAPRWAVVSGTEVAA